MENKSLSPNIQISNSLRKKILEGYYSPGDHLPTEFELAEQFGTSRGTVRKALNLLSSEKIISSQQGKGYFVRKPDFNHYSMEFDLFSLGNRIETRVIDMIEASENISRVLGTEEGRAVIYIQTVIYHDSEPIACEDKYLPYFKGYPTIESLMQYPHNRDRVTQKLNSYDIHHEIRISSGPVSAEHRKLLECREDESVLKLIRMIKNQYDEVLAYGIVSFKDAEHPLIAYSGFLNKTQEKNDRQQ